MEGLHHFVGGIRALLEFNTLFHVLWATLLGITVGMMPGLTATLGLALMTTLTFQLPSQEAILILICMYVGAIYGGSRSAILLNIPGTPANAATALDGYPLARAGKVGKAMGIATAGSVLGTLIGMVFLAILAPWLGEVALKFHSYEFFWLAVLGVVISGRLTALDDPLKGWIAGVLGLLIAMVGQETLHAYPRFSFGIGELTGGFGLLPVLVGIFGFAEILTAMKAPVGRAVRQATDSVIPRIQEVIRYWRSIIRSGVSGTFMGLVPGVGEDMGAWVSYGLARNASKEKEQFGKGSVEGLLSAETGNSAAVPGSIIPVLTLAIPGSAPTAVLLAALLIHGVRPGPLIMEEAPELIFQIVAMILFASVAILVYGLALTKPLLKVLAVPRDKLMPVIFVLCTVGAFAVAGRIFDIWVMVGFGILGFILRELKFPMAPLILGVVLGPLLDVNLRRGLVISDGSLVPFFTRPISMFLWLLILLTVLLGMKPVLRALAGVLGGRKKEERGEAG